MQHRAYLMSAAAHLMVLLVTAITPSRVLAADSRELQVSSKDGTPIAFECAGSGPELLIVHGGAGDRTRWLPMLRILTTEFTVCAMDRRAHGRSGDTLPYSLQKEAEDVATVVRSRRRPVAVLAHSFGAVATYEAALHSPTISKLILYEPPIIVGNHEEVLAKVEGLLAAGDRDGATRAFMGGIVGITPSGLAKMQKQPSWPGLVDSIDYSVRQDRALTAYRWDPERAKQLRIPVLLLSGSLTRNPDILDSLKRLSDTLPNSSAVVIEGQEHNAMDDDRERLAAVVRRFLVEVH